MSLRVWGHTGGGIFSVQKTAYIVTQSATLSIREVLGCCCWYCSLGVGAIFQIAG
jgi:hypothetical protein